MKVVVLAGGLGTRLSEETAVRPKPMVHIGGQPILWHILKIYAHYGHTDFVICGGYRADVIKDYFHNYLIRTSDVTFDMAANRVEIHPKEREPWTVTVVDTGDGTMTGGRVRRVKHLLNGERFLLTYGDGVSDVDINSLISFHEEQGAAVTLTAVQPPGRFGAMVLSHDQRRIETFFEKPSGDGAWINGGFFVVEPEALDHIEGDSTVWEQEPLQNLARDERLFAYRHRGFWHSMDTLRDKHSLESIWESGDPPWRVWGRD